jgi:hypothetical protein
MDQAVKKRETICHNCGASYGAGACYVCSKQRDELLREAGYEAGLEAAAKIMDVEADHHAVEMLAFGDPDYGSPEHEAFYAEEFARQCCKDSAEKIRMLSPKRWRP